MRTLVRFLNFIIVFAFAAVIFWYEFANNSFTAHWNNFLTIRGPFILVCVAAVIVLLNIYTLIHTLKQLRKRKRAIEVQTDNGLNSISIDAVQKRLSEILASTEDVLHPRLYLEIGHKNKPVKCSVEFGLKCTKNITGRTDEIKGLLRDAFNIMIPGSSGIDIQASIIDIEGDAVTIKTKHETVFSGPVYPNDEEEQNGREEN